MVSEDEFRSVRWGVGRLVVGSGCSLFSGLVESLLEYRLGIVSVAEELEHPTSFLSEVFGVGAESVKAEELGVGN